MENKIILMSIFTLCFLISSIYCENITNNISLNNSSKTYLLKSLYLPTLKQKCIYEFDYGNNLYDILNGICLKKCIYTYKRDIGIITSNITINTSSEELLSFDCLCFNLTTPYILDKKISKDSYIQYVFSKYLYIIKHIHIKNIFNKQLSKKIKNIKFKKNVVKRYMKNNQIYDKLITMDKNNEIDIKFKYIKKEFINDF